MSYMTPYYFSASAGQSVNLWLRSNEFDPFMGVAHSGSTSLISASIPGWQYTDVHSGSGLRFTAPTTDVYVVECTSQTDGQTGSFRLAVTAGETSSLELGFPVTFSGPFYSTATVNTMIYATAADRIWAGAGITSAASNTWSYTQSLQVVNPQSNVVVFNLHDDSASFYTSASGVLLPTSTNTGSRLVIDYVYNSVNTNVYVWVAKSGPTDNLGAVGVTQSYMEIWNASGSVLLATHSMAEVTWGGAQFGFGNLCFNPIQNQLLILPRGAGFGPTNFSYSLYNCNTDLIDHTELMADAYSYPTYVSTTGLYYAASQIYGNPAIKISDTAFTHSLSSITNSAIVLTYVPELDVIVGGGNNFKGTNVGPARIYNVNETIKAELPGINDMETPCAYDTCKKCLVIPDDAAGDPNYSGGGFSYLFSGSWAPINFESYLGAWYVLWVPSTSTVWAASYDFLKVLAIPTTIPTASLPQPPYPTPPPPAPPAPIQLQVSSGSAILDWVRSGSISNFSHWSVQRATAGEAGPYSNYTQSQNTHSIDRLVNTGQQYWYRVAAVNDVATSSFSNIGTINVVPCSGSDFNAVIYAGYVSPATASTYHNFYGTVLHFTTSVSQSISIWGRSPDFDVFLTLADSNGNILATNDLDGWSPSGDQSGFGENAALVYNLSSGSYDIEISSADNAIGRFLVSVSPGPKLEYQWGPSVEPGYTDTITSNGWVLVGENGSSAIFFNPFNQSGSHYSPPNGVQGTAYSPIQDKCYAWTYIGPDGNGVYSMSIDVFDHTGSLLRRNSYPRFAGTRRDVADYSGYLCYDGKNDRIFFHSYNFITASFPSWHVMDCGTETFIHSGALLNPGHFQYWECAYAWSNNCYYVAPAQNNQGPLNKIDAATYTVTTTSFTSNVICNYISSSGLLITRTPGGNHTVQLCDPLTDTVVHNCSDLPSNSTALFEGGGLGDPCTNTYVMGIDPRSGDGGVNNKSCVALIDRNTYLPVNYLKINDTVPSGFSPDGYYQYSCNFNLTTSRAYLSQQSFDTDSGSLYSIRCTRAIGAYNAPYTSSAADTASCLHFRTEFASTASNASTCSIIRVCSSKSQSFGASGFQTIVVSDLESVVSGVHNFNNIFLGSTGTYYNNYTSSFTHFLSGKNAVSCNSKFYMLDDGTNVFGVSLLPITSSNVLVFDKTGSLLTTIPLTFGAMDWDTDGTDVFVYEKDGLGDNTVYVETIDTTTDAISSTDQLQVGYTFTPSFVFLFGTASLSSSTPALSSAKQYPYFGRMMVLSRVTNGNTFWYFNDITAPSASADPAPIHIPDTGSGDRIWMTTGAVTALYNYVGNRLDMSTGSYKRWSGGMAYCPVNDSIYWSAVDTGSNPILIKTDTFLSVARTIPIPREVQTLVWNKKHLTIEMYDNTGASGSDGHMSVFSPLADAVVCTIDTTTTGSAMGDMGYSIDVNPVNGDVYVPQRLVDGGVTGSVRVWKV